MRVRLEPRAASPLATLLGAPLFALAGTLLTGALVFALIGRDPVAGLAVFTVEPLRTMHGLAELGVKAAPLILCAVGLSICFRANIWNIGAEGQLIAGAIAAGGMALALDDMRGAWLAALVAGAMGGVAWSAITAFLRDRFRANEILTSLMLTYVASLLLAWIVQGPWKDPEGFNFPQSKLFAAQATLPLIAEGTRLHVGFALALVAAIAGWILIARSFIGFQLQVSGLAPLAARFAGFSSRKGLWIALCLSGGLAGLAGASEVLGPIGQLTPTVSPGYGFAAIIVAFVARLHPLGVIPASVLMALFYIGGELAQSRLGLPAALTGVFQGLLLFWLLAADVFVAHRLRLATASAH